MNERQPALNKALEINLNTQIYGAFAEIGAGQEVARYFFQAGKASQTIAKTISAYDMIYSDEIYGKEANGRYVCESRVQKMLDKEYSLMQRRLEASRGANTCFFSYANTVATGDQKKRFSHGWMGVKFQIKPKGETNQIILHVRLLDKHRLQQQESLGVLGVNLVYAAFTSWADPTKIIPILTEGIKQGQIAIDLIRFSGPDLKNINNHLMNLELVRRGLADAVLFSPKNEILSISDELYQKSCIIERGIFRPVTNTHLDVLEKGHKQFKTDFPEETKSTIELFELTMNTLTHDGHVQEKDFLDRTRSLTSLGKHVLVSNFFLFYNLKKFLRYYTQKPLILIMSASHLKNVFTESHYQDLDGGMLEGLGRLLDDKTRLYIYPHKTKMSCTTAKTFHPEPHLNAIYKHFIDQKQIADISGCDEISEYLHSDFVKDLILAKDKKWEACVPPSVRDQIKKENLFSFF
jgi:hypothetical protein